MEQHTVTDAKAHLNELIEDVASTHNRVAITRNGKPSVCIIAVADFEAMEESLYWLSQPGILEDIAHARAEHAAGTTKNTAEMMRELRAPR